LAEVPSDAKQLSFLLPGSTKLEEVPSGSLDSFVLYAPPSTLERQYTLALGLQALRAGGTLVALAPKDKGGSRIAKELRGFGCEVEEDSKSHHRICRTARPPILAGVEAAIRAGAPRMLPELGLWTQPGVFSWNRLDEGSALLLEHLPAFSGAGADLGCGLGVLARAVLKSALVTELSLYDIDRRAVACARKNVSDSRARFHWEDVRALQAAAPLDFVVANPPFHDTGIEDRELGRAFVLKAAEILKPGGRAWFVANRHLPYEDTLRESFAQMRIVAENKAFKIIEAVK
jgi:16S rRNA (guanine1207-N2)-methyltransferase